MAGFRVSCTGILLVVVYDDPRGAITVKFPIAKKDGRYYFALRKE